MVNNLKIMRTGIAIGMTVMCVIGPIYLLSLGYKLGYTYFRKRVDQRVRELLDQDVPALESVC